jgi:hypothetical protein
MFEAVWRAATARVIVSVVSHATWHRWLLVQGSPLSASVYTPPGTQPISGDVQYPACGVSAAQASESLCVYNSKELLGLWPRREVDTYNFVAATSQDEVGSFAVWGGCMTRFEGPFTRPSVRWGAATIVAAAAAASEEMDV